MSRVLMVLLLVMLSGCASLQPVSEAQRTFDTVYEVKDKSKAAIFTATKIWIAENFRSAKAVIEYESEADGVLIGNGIIPYPCSGLDCVTKQGWSIPFTMRVDMKDQKCKVTFSNVNLSWPPAYTSVGAQPGHDGPVGTQGDMDAIKPALLGLSEKLVAAIRNNSSSASW